MFVSFFPRPRLFLISVLVWMGLATVLWYVGGENWGRSIGLTASAGSQPVGVAIFWVKPFFWVFIYYWSVVALFAGGWQLYAPHPWSRWSIWGSALIIFMTYLQVQVSVA